MDWTLFCLGNCWDLFMNSRISLAKKRQTVLVLINNLKVCINKSWSIFSDFRVKSFIRSQLLLWLPYGYFDQAASVSVLILAPLISASEAPTNSFHEAWIWGPRLPSRQWMVRWGRCVVNMTGAVDYIQSPLKHSPPCQPPRDISVTSETILRFNNSFRFKLVLDSYI